MRQRHTLTLWSPWLRVACSGASVDVLKNWTYSQLKRQTISESFMRSFYEVHRSISFKVGGGGGCRSD